MERHRLSNAENFQLLTWLNSEEIRALILNETDETLTEKAKAALGFEVIASHIVSGRKTLNIKKRERKPAGEEDPAAADLSALEALLGEQAKHLTTLMHNYNALSQRMRNVEDALRGRGVKC